MQVDQNLSSSASMTTFWRWFIKTKIIYIARSYDSEVLQGKWFILPFGSAKGNAHPYEEVWVESSCSYYILILMKWFVLVTLPEF